MAKSAAKATTKTTKTTAKASPKPKAVAKAVPKASAKSVAKPAAKAGGKAAPKKVSKKVDAGLKALADELAGLIPELDAEGLSFLIEQANVHLYNMRVAELEEAQTRLDSIKAAHGAGKGAKAKAKAEAQDTAFRIESASNGSTYDLVYNDKWKMFTSEEMLAMVRIVSVKDPVDQVGGRLYRWLMAERMDVIQDLPLGGLADPLLKKLVAKLRATFTVKGTK